MKISRKQAGDSTELSFLAAGDTFYWKRKHFMVCVDNQHIEKIDFIRAVNLRTGEIESFKLPVTVSTTNAKVVLS